MGTIALPFRRMVMRGACILTARSGTAFSTYQLLVTKNLAFRQGSSKDIYRGCGNSDWKCNKRGEVFLYPNDTSLELGTKKLWVTGNYSRDSDENIHFNWIKDKIGRYDIGQVYIYENMLSHDKFKLFAHSLTDLDLTDSGGIYGPGREWAFSFGDILAMTPKLVKFSAR